jgi:hypothetical protein
MNDMFKYPLYALALSFFAQWLSARIGDSFRNKIRPLEEPERKDFGIVVTAALTP